MHREPEHFIRDEIKCTIIFLCSRVFLRSPKNAFIMQSKSTFLEFLDGNSSLQICPPPRKNSLGANSLGGNYVIAIYHVLCLSHVSLTYVSGRLVCLTSQLTFYLRLVYLLVEFWTVLPCCVDCYQASCVVYF